MLKRVCLTTLLIIQLTSFTPARRTSHAQTAANSAVFAFVDVNVVPMDSERVIRGQTVVVRSGRVVLMGATGSVRVPKGATRIEGRNRYLIPGLADMHVHLEYFDREAQLLLFLANGVTAVRSMDGRPNILAWRKRIADGTLPGPTIFTAGAILEGKPPQRDDNRVVETPAQAGPAVEEQKRAGYDFVKVYHTLSRDTYEAIVAAAKKQGLAVAGHVPRSVGLRSSLAAGQRSIEHLDGYAEEIEADGSPLRNQRSWLKRYFAVRVDDNKIRGIVEVTRRAEVWNVPTLVESQKSALPPETVKTWLKQPEMKYLPPQTGELWRQANERITRRMSPEDFKHVAEGERVRERLVKFLHEGGARLLAGTDTPNAFVIPGFSLHEELQNLVDAGLTPYQALKAGTRDAAEFVGGLNEVGTISVGKRADLVLLEGNPLENITNTTRRAGVMARGQWYAAESLQKQLDALAASYAIK
jgi:imidazolonepropionase-like amidohydrolase